jgi:hypothetical protein
VAASSSLPQGHPSTRPRAYTWSASFFPTIVFFPAILLQNETPLMLRNRGMRFPLCLNAELKP